MRAAMVALGAALVILVSPAARGADGSPLPGTKRLTMEGDLAAQMVEGVDKFLQRKLDASAAVRDRAWRELPDDEVGRQAFLEIKRQRLEEILGLRDQRVAFDAPELMGTTRDSGLVGTAERYKIYAVRWPVVGEIMAEGLLCVPNDDLPYVADVIAIPDADQTPEDICGLVKGLDADAQFARLAAERGCRVLVPTLISRRYEARNGRAKMTNREYIYRPAFELGRTLIGYEVETVRAGVDWFARERGKEARIGVVGYGEGGMIALYAAALDRRIGSTAISGYLGRKERLWQQPLDRNLFGILNEFGDAEVTRLVAGALHVAFSPYPEVTLPSEGGAPAELRKPPVAELNAEWDRIIKYPLRGAGRTAAKTFEEGPLRGGALVKAMLQGLGHQVDAAAEQAPPIPGKSMIEANARQARLLRQMDRHNQQLLAESPYVRAEFMKGLDTSTEQAFEKSQEPYREKFRREVIGWFDDEPLPPNPRTRKIIEHEKYDGYEVVLDVWPDVFAYGILLLPKGPHPGPYRKGEGPDNAQRPVVVCQHGLEGRPQDVVQGDHPAYHDFAAKLAERGFITFSPQNLYIGKDKFRVLQRKANPLGKTLFSVIIPQHQQIVEWLQTLPQVDGSRIGFYGLSYGGKSAMRIPPLVPQYALSICSADFNDWVWKNASTRSPYSYVWTGEYEIFEWNLGSTFNYSEMAALIAPRPFMVERGHFDGVAPDERVALEFAKVRHLYNARLKMGERTKIAWFAGPHTIDGGETFPFLHQHLSLKEP